MTKVQFKKVFIPTGKERIAATIAKPEKATKAPVIILLTGSGGVKERFESIQKYFSQRGFICVAFDFRGRGESSGQPMQKTLLDEIEDVNAVHRYVKNLKRVDRKDITLVGHSRGAFAAAIVAHKLKVKNLVLSAPATYLARHEDKPLSKTVEYKKNILPTLGRDISQTGGVKNLSKFTRNLVVMEHEQDGIIPPWTCRAYFDAAKTAKSRKYLVLKNVGHAALTRGDWKRKLAKVIEDWLKNQA